MKCDQSKLADFLNGQLPPAEMEEMLSHLGQCRGCDALFQDLLRFRSLAPEISAGLSSDFYRFEESASRSRRWVLIFGTAAAILAGLVGGLFALRSYLLREAPVSLASLLETQPYEYLAPVVRGQNQPPDVERAAIMALYEREDYPEFIAAVSRWMDRHPPESRMLFFAGVAAYLIPNYGAAETYLQWSLETDPRRPLEVLWYLANTHLRRGNPDKARPLLAEIAGTDHPYAPKAAQILRLLPASRTTPAIP